MTRVFLFWVIGIAATAVFGDLASIEPSTFGLFTLPFWILPALLGLGVHDNIFPLGLLGASLFHRAVSFAVDRLAVGGMRGSPEIASPPGFRDRVYYLLLACGYVEARPLQGRVMSYCDLTRR
jgi:hypothetical protein